MMGGKIYVINSPQLVQAAFKNSKGISFIPIVNEYISRIHELSPSARQNYTQDGMHERMMQIFTSTMAGGSLRQMNVVAVKEIYRMFEDNHGTKVQGTTVKEVESLWKWVRDMMTMITTTTFLGAEHNPWRNDPSLVEAYW